MGKLSLFNSSIIDWWIEEDRQRDEYIERQKTFAGPPHPDSFDALEMKLIRQYTLEELNQGKHITFDIPPKYTKKG